MTSMQLIYEELRYPTLRNTGNQLQGGIQLLTNICISVIFNNFSQLKMAGHNGHLITKKTKQNNHST